MPGPFSNITNGHPMRRDVMVNERIGDISDQTAFSYDIAIQPRVTITECPSAEQFRVKARPVENRSPHRHVHAEKESFAVQPKFLVRLHEAQDAEGLLVSHITQQPLRRLRFPKWSYWASRSHHV